MKILLLAALLAGCGQEGDKDEEPTTFPAMPTEVPICNNGNDGVNEDSSDQAGPEGPSGPPGPQGQQGMDGSNCRVLERVVYNDEGELRENRCDIYLKCGEDKEIFVLRKKERCN